MLYEHYAHCDKLHIKKGQIVKRGQLIATVGNTGTKWAHLHYEIHKQDPAIRGYTAYSTGLSRSQVEKIYANPHNYITNAIPTKYASLGHDWLSRVNANTFHPGLDINGPGGGNADLGQPIYANFDGEVVWTSYRYGNGWGRHFYIRQIKSNDTDKMAIRDSLNETTHRKAKEMAFLEKVDTGSGNDLSDYFVQPYGRKKLGDLNYKAYIDYLWKHPDRKKKLSEYYELKKSNKKISADLSAAQKETDKLKKKLEKASGGEEAKKTLESVKDSLKKLLGLK